MEHYTYHIEDRTTGEFYIGVRTCKGSANKDGYMGSMTAWKPNKNNLWKRIIATYPTRQEANLAERELIETWIEHPWNRNAHIPSIGFCMIGVKHTPETRANMSQAKMGNQARKGKKHSLETRIKMSEAMKAKVFTVEHRKKLSEAKIGKPSNNKKQKPA